MAADLGARQWIARQMSSEEVQPEVRLTIENKKRRQLLQRLAADF